MLMRAKAVMDERGGREVRRPVRGECKRCDLALFGISNRCLFCFVVVDGKGPRLAGLEEGLPFHVGGEYACVGQS